MNGREGFATAANKCCKVLKGKGPGYTPASGVSPEGSPKMPKSLGDNSTARLVGVLECNGQALPHCWARKTAAPSLSSCSEGVLQLFLPGVPSTTTQVLFLASRVMFPAQGTQGEWWLKFSPRTPWELHQIT